MRKNQKLMRAIVGVTPALPVFALAAMSGWADAALNIYEPFNYSTGTLQGNTNAGGGTANGNLWQRAGVANPPTGINVTSGNLSGPVELPPSVGNDLTISHVLVNDGSTNRLALDQNYTTGFVYYSFLLNVSSLTNSNNTTGAFFLSLNNSADVSQATNPTVVPGKIQVRIDPTDGTKYNLGVFGQASATAVSPGWATNQLDTGTTQLVVAAANPSTKVFNLWINPNPSSFGLSAPPTVTSTLTDSTTWTGNNIQSLLVRQNLLLPDLVIDELRVGSTWSDVTPTLSAYWDINGATAGAGGATPSGTWSGAISNWSASSAGDVATTLFPGAGYKAIFSAGTDATGAYTVTVSGTQSAASLSFEEGTTVTLTGGTVSLSTGAIETGSGVTARIESTISSTAGLSKNGAGTVLVPGNMSYTGATTINAGTLQIGDGGTTGALPTGSAIANNGTLVFNRSNDVTQGTDFSGSAITGTGNLTQAGSANLILNAANTFTGTTKATSGSILVTHSLALQNSTVDTSGAGSIVFDNALSAISVGGLAGNTNYTYGGSGLAITVTGAIRNATFGGAIGGSSSVTMNGTIAQELNNTTNSYTGGTTINSGVLQFGATNSMPATGLVVANNGGTLSVHLGGAGEWTNATSGAGSIGDLIAGNGGQGTAGQVLWQAGSTLGINTQPVGASTSSADITYSGAIANFNGSSNSVGFSKRGYGALTLDGSGNNFNGQLQVANEGGTLKLKTAVPNAGQSMSTPTVYIGNALNTTTPTPTMLKVLTNNALPSNSLIQFGSAVAGTSASKPIFRLHDEDPVSTLGGGSTLPASGSYNQTVRGISGGGGQVHVGGGTLTINVPLGESYSWSGIIRSDADAAWKSGNTSGVHGTVIKTGQGRQDFNSIDDDLTGEFIVQDGTVGIGNQQAFGGRLTATSDSTMARLVVNGGKLMNTSGSALTMSVNFLDIGGSFTFDPNGTNDAQWLGSSKLITLQTANPTITVLGTGGSNTSGKLIFASKITDNGAGYGFTKAGTGTLNMTPVAFLPNTYSGATTVQEGTIRLTVDSLLGNGSSDVNLTGGTLEFNGTPVGGTGSDRLYTLTNPLHVPSGTTNSIAYNTTTGNLTDVTDPNGIQFVLSNNTIDGTGTLNFNYYNLASGTTVTFRPRFTGNGFNYAGPVVITNATGGRNVVLESGNTSGWQTWSGNVTGTGSFSRLTGGSTLLAGSLVSVGGISVANNSSIKIDQGGSRTVKTGALNIGTSSSTLDLTNNKMIVTGVAAGSWNGSAYTGVSALVKSGQGTITGMQPAWDGSGIVTTMTTATSSILTTLAVASAADVKGISGGQTATFAGQTVSATDALIAYTYTGDANLDGRINADDYFQVDSNYNKSGAGLSYFRGDFNYDGQVNGDDYFLIDNAFVSQTTAYNNAPGADLGGVSAVPEPASVGLLIAAAAGLTARRRRRQ